MISMLRTWTLILLAVSLAACDGPGPAGDGGTSDGGDGGSVETVAPAVIATLPADGDVEVSPTRSIRVVFSEPIDPEAGTLELTSGDDTLALDAPALSEDGRELTVSPSSPLPGNAEVRVAVEGFRDLAGNAMSAAHAFTFTTSDPFAPSVTSATPAEGASGVAPETATLEVDFSEAMNATLGVATLEGGPGAIGAPTWDGAHASFPLEGLAPNTAYRVLLTGFADPAGNPLDGEPYLGDGALDFTTGGDMTAPVVTESTPREGQTTLPPSPTTRLRIVFSEPMDTSAGAAALEQGSASTELEASWAGGGSILLLEVGGLLDVELAYRVVLTGFTDVAGNALDGAPYLEDGALDFVTGEDEPAPFVLFSNPAETEAGVRWTTDALFVTFSEGMDTTITEVPFTDGISSGTFTGTWSSGGALLELDVAGRLISGRTYELDFTAFRDADGLSLDARHVYLGDGTLTFTMAAPEGENCQDFLTNAEATVSGAVSTWTIAEEQVSNVDGAASCDASGGSPDAVIRYTKTSPDSTDASGAGRVLRVTVTSSSDLDVEVLQGGCDPASAVRLSCLANLADDEPHSFDLDVPAGDYFLWVASSAGDFDGATVTVEEIPAGLGDTCRNAIPITAGTTAITPSGAQNLNAPGCTDDAPLTWYRYTAGQRLGLVTLDGARAVAGMDAASGAHLLCRTDAVTTPMPMVIEPGSDGCIAVASGDAASITIEEVPDYTGVRGALTDLGLTLPSGSFSAPAIPLMGVTPSRIYLATFDILYAPRTGGAVATEYEPPSAHPIPGDNGVFIGEVFYSLSSNSVSADEPRPMVYQVTDSTGAFLDPPTPIDTTFPYVPGPSMAAIVVDGTDFLFAQDTSSSLAVTNFYSVPIAGGPATLIGSNNVLESVSAMAVDSTYIYVISRTAGGEQASEGIYRLRRDQLATPDASPELVYTGGENWPDGTGALYLDSTGATEWLYFRTYNPASVHLLLDPDEATPRYLGTLFEQSNVNRMGLAHDPAAPALFLIDHGPSPDLWLRMD